MEPLLGADEILSLQREVKRKPAPGAAFKDTVTPFKELRFLVIEDQEASRKTLKMCIQSMGGFSIEIAVSHGDAIFRIKNNVPDIIICDYILGDGRTGQQLLEELRHTATLPNRVVFLMVTAERSYEQVVSAVELTPDDYVIKPFSPEVLGLRIEKAVQKKLAFRTYYDLREAHQFDEAVQELDAMLARDQAKPYKYDIFRYRAETLADAGCTDEAQRAYEDIIRIHPFPWAKAGLARMLHRKDRLPEARATVDEVIAMSPNYFEAYDLKAAICSDSGDYAEAQKTLAHAAERAPRNWSRKRTLSTVALHNGDFETATAVMRDVVVNDAAGGASLHDSLNMARCALAGGDVEAAKAAMHAAAKTNLDNVGDAERVEFECVLAVLEGAAGAARYERICRTIVRLSELPVQTAVDVARAALAFYDRQTADRVIEQMLGGKQARLAFQPLLGIYKLHGLEEPFRKIQNRAALKRLHK
ncbi:MAG: response regulator [Rhodocyclaceae bacterium]|nr:response regulator [Rhodocyclaceae bacterium]